EDRARPERGGAEAHRADTQRGEPDDDEGDDRGALHSPICTTSSSPPAYRERTTFLSNLPTLVLGTASMNAHRSGSCQRAIRSPRNSRSSSAVAVVPSRSTTVASGRSLHFSSGT